MWAVIDGFQFEGPLAVALHVISSKYSAEILARSLANFCCSYGDRYIDLYFIRYGNEQESAQCENLLS